MRRIFIIGEFEERVQRGELTVRPKPGSEHPAPAKLNEVPGTVSRILQYFDLKGELVAMTHEYVRPDGTLAASGKRDPKWIFLDGVIYKQGLRAPQH